MVVMRKMSCVWLVWVAFCLAVFPLHAQQTDAKTVMERVAESFRKAGGIRAGFTVSASTGSSSGSICLKGDKFVLEAGGITTWFDGHTQWSYLVSSDEVNVSEPTADELQSLNPYAWLSLYRNGYRAELGKMNNSRESALYYKVILAATDKRRDVQSIVLHVSRKDYRPARIILQQRGGEQADIVITSCQTGQNWPDSYFVFDKQRYPSAEVIDLR